MVLIQILVIYLCKHQCNQIHNPLKSANGKYNVSEVKFSGNFKVVKVIQE